MSGENESQRLELGRCRPATDANPPSSPPSTNHLHPPRNYSPSGSRSLVARDYYKARCIAQPASPGYASCIRYRRKVDLCRKQLCAPAGYSAIPHQERPPLLTNTETSSKHCDMQALRYIVARCKGDDMTEAMIRN